MKRLSIAAILLVTLFACQKPYDFSNNTSGNTNTSNYNSYNYPLAGTKWVVYQYRESTANVAQTISDTLIFLNDRDCKWNQVYCSYSMDQWSGSYRLIIYDSPFGDINGKPATTFIQYGKMLEVPFQQMTGNHTYYLSMRKI